MKTKVTIKDIAREAGVSVATVSYVLNNRQDQKISDETRDKVLHISNLLNYTPNQAARSLVMRQSNSIVLYYKQSHSILVQAEQMHIINTLSSFLHQNNYQLVCLSDKMIEQFDWADVILTFDISNESFYKIGQLNFKPLIALNALINDPLFFQINTNYLEAKKKAEAFFNQTAYHVISLPVNNKHLRERLVEIFPNIIFCDIANDLNAYKDKPILILNNSLDQFFNDHPNKYYLDSLDFAKCDLLLQAIKWAKNRKLDKNHNLLI
ncbi:LacI family DNA-binding transcriptional regulator [Streptococcus hongkongensis]|nr:LacI family transcriptional regulator [Streptococcus uberis]